ncbi:MAG: histidinol dehydrogenase [Chloroflexota bacterium]|mgnify:CR=1 FL=1
MPELGEIEAGRPTIRLRRLDLSVGAVDAEAAADWRRLVRRGAAPDIEIRATVRGIVHDVRAGGSDAVRDANRRYGGGLRREGLRREGLRREGLRREGLPGGQSGAPTPAGDLVIDGAALLRARDALDARIRSALETSIANVRRFAETQRPPTTRTTIADGVEIERRWTPLASVGAYVPGGSAPYPSSLVMTVVPARVAGVGTVVVATPAGPGGTIDPILLGAAGLLEVDAVLVAGGAQAIAALAFGLPDVGIGPVDRIVGPGNAWVTAAKIELAGEVGIDLPAGPSEGMVLAGPTSDPVIIAADLITQAEHGPDSPAILVTTDGAFADAVERAILAQLAEAPRRAILELALGVHGRIVLAADLDAAIGLVNEYAPEHLSVDVEPLEETVTRLHSAGSIFVGRWAPESAGDYATGANHVLPTGGLARSTGPLSVEAFGRYSQVQRITREGLAGLRSAITTLAGAEGLAAHRAAVELRFRQEET